MGRVLYWFHIDPVEAWIQSWRSLPASGFVRTLVGSLIHMAVYLGPIVLVECIFRTRMWRISESRWQQLSRHCFWCKFDLYSVRPTDHCPNCGRPIPDHQRVYTLAAKYLKRFPPHKLSPGPLLL